jgi:hypothetical protein
MTKPPLETVTGGCDVRMRVTSTKFGNRYVIKVCHNAEIPLKVMTGTKIGSGQGLANLDPGKTWRYEFGALENRPYINEAMDEITFEFPDGRNVNLYHEIPCWVAFGLQRTGHSRTVSIQ